MSSEDEMNNWEQRLDTRPPNATKPRAQPRKKTKASSPGPSSAPQEKPSKRVHNHLDSDGGNDDAVVDAPSAKPGPKSKSRPKTTSVANGHQDQKGQEKATSSKSTKKHPVSDDAMEVDERESEVNVQTTSRPTTAGTSHTHSSSEAKYRKELDQWKKKTIDLEAQRDALSKQLEELFQIRKTEPEQALEQLQIQYDERAKIQDALIKELTSQLARVEPLSRTGQAVALHFLTREAADEEKRAAEQDISRLKEVIKAKDTVIDEKNKRIAELEQQVQDVIRERDAEIERSKELLARAAPKGTPNSRSHIKRPFGMDDPKMTEVIKFYEDMSNLLVTNVRFEHSPDSEEPEVIFHCIYTYYEMTRRADDIEGERIGEKSIVFTMRIFNGFGGPNGEPASEDDFIHRRIKYTPLHLDKEPEAFVKGLEYIGDSFTFPCAQQGLFLNSLCEKIRDAAKDTSESGSDIELGDHDS
ncbi:hypothetical protein V8E55_011044 [Tylopilus felleus]